MLLFGIAFAERKSRKKLAEELIQLQAMSKGQTTMIRGVRHQARKGEMQWELV